MSLVTRNSDEFFNYARQLPNTNNACAKTAFLVTPIGFRIAEQSAIDNRYMDVQVNVNSELAMQQHQQLQLALSKHLPCISFVGRVETPDAVFPNNVFATVPGKLLLASMRHPVRQAEAERKDIQHFFTKTLNYTLEDLRQLPGVGELTGSMVIDRAREIGFCGLGERCDEAGARAMAEAMGLKACLMFDLAPTEYHTNVVLSILAGRAVVIAPDGFVDAAIADAISALYSPHVVMLSVREKQAFAANCIALTQDTVWMSSTAAQALSEQHTQKLIKAGFAIQAVELSEIEKGGGSLRCCVGEIF
jgi:hypothetical protein